MTRQVILVIICFREVMNLKKLLLIIAAVMLTASCAGQSDTSYVNELRERGADEEEIDALIEYEKNNENLPEGGYVDVTGRTIEEVAKERGLTLEEYLAEFDLPEDMPGLVSENEAYYTIPAKRMAELLDMSFDTLKQVFNLPESVTEETTWGEAMGETTLGAYAGEDNVESFKEMYKLDDSVTADTLWKDVREQVDAVKKEQRETQQTAEPEE